MRGVGGLDDCQERTLDEREIVVGDLRSGRFGMISVDEARLRNQPACQLMRGSVHLCVKCAECLLQKPHSYCMVVS